MNLCDVQQNMKQSLQKRTFYPKLHHLEQQVLPQTRRDRRAGEQRGDRLQASCHRAFRSSSRGLHNTTQLLNRCFSAHLPTTACHTKQLWEATSKFSIFNRNSPLSYQFDLVTGHSGDQLLGEQSCLRPPLPNTQVLLNYLQIIIITSRALQ